MKIFVLALAALVLFVAAGCGGDDIPGAPGSGAAAEPLSIADALASDLDEPLLVEGAVVALEDEPVRLCSALLESYPPQCGEPSLEVRGLDLEDVGALETSAGDPSVSSARWSDRPIRILGTVEDGVLTMSTTAAG